MCTFVVAAGDLTALRELVRFFTGDSAGFRGLPENPLAVIKVIIEFADWAFVEDPGANPFKGEGGRLAGDLKSDDVKFAFKGASKTG